ncbi:Tropinone reductase -like protein [Capsicum baccatum]|uniref:Tropinone reductase-like protein n=1 Tax=Capsicum baccatum TaxID=33114 RepID=A0A2G2WN35_CAPBA|nr:Tropinone reductase -like protein [Capsicum baccatum]
MTKFAGSRWSLNGLVALVTGGTYGIGHGIVEELAELGAKVYTCSRDETKLNECLQQCLPKAFKYKINTVGTNIWKPIVEYTAEDYAHMMSTNLESSFHMCQLAHPLLKSSGAGTIVFISSVAGLVHHSGTPIYGATKGAMNQLTRDLACEWAKDGIRVNGVAPCYTNTPLVKHVIAVDGGFTVYGFQQPGY